MKFKMLFLTFLTMSISTPLIAENNPTKTSLGATDKAQLLAVFQANEKLHAAFFDYDQKKEVLNSVWAIAFADGEMDKHEEHLIRRIADLLYLNHKDFINAKLNQKETNEDS